ncbi:MAG TPA: AraC family transcriptional regulator ligand-binding domain-containing protein [Burkholderiaceae bacterium]|nr:AraC family transcriptional regulator ligand-binding domain-containing protein [Burkholderiaceae bacterium]
MATIESPITIPVYYLNGVLNAARQQNVDTEPLLKRLGIHLPELGSPHARISLKNYSQIYAALVAELDDEMLGQLHTPIRFGFIELLCRVSLSVETIRDAAVQAATLMRVTSSQLDVRTSVNEGETTLTIGPERPEQFAGDRLFAYLVIFISIHAVLSWLARHKLELKAVGFPCAAPEGVITELDQVFECPILYDQPTAFIVLTPFSSAARIQREGGDVPKFMCQAPGSFVEALLQRGRVSVLTRELLRDALPHIPTLNEVARRLALSPRSLHRKLASEGETFQSLKEQLRRDLAIYALVRSKAPLKQIAADLGFADQATFQRAFVQWTGLTPGAYRRP